MRELGLSSYEISSRYMINSLTTYLRDIKWNSNETVLTGIGQSITEVTPIGVAGYICAIANGRTVLEAQIVDKILSSDGAVVTEKEPVVVNQIEGAEEHLSIIREGMHGVISAEDGGTAAKYWSDFPYTDQIGAKTARPRSTKSTSKTAPGSWPSPPLTIRKSPSWSPSPTATRAAPLP